MQHGPNIKYNEQNKNKNKNDITTGNGNDGSTAANNINYVVYLLFCIYLFRAYFRSRWYIWYGCACCLYFVASYTYILFDCCKPVRLFSFCYYYFILEFSLSPLPCMCVVLSLVFVCFLFARFDRISSYERWAVHPKR